MDVSHPTVFHPAFSNYAYLFCMVKSCACVSLDNPTIIFYQLLVLITFCFPGPIITGIDTLWVLLLLEFSTDHFETIHICSICACGFGVILLLYGFKTHN